MLRDNAAYLRTYDTHALEEALMKRDATAATARHTLLRAYAYFFFYKKGNMQHMRLRGDAHAACLDLRINSTCVRT